MPWAYINRFVIFSVQWTLAWWCWWRHNSFLQDPGSGGQLAMKQCAIVNCLQIINNMPGYDQWLGCCASSNLILISSAQQLVVNWIFSIQTCLHIVLVLGVSWFLRESVWWLRISLAQFSSMLFMLSAAAVMSRLLKFSTISPTLGILSFTLPSWV